MKFIVVFEDAKDAGPDIRKLHMKDHLAFLERNKDLVEAAGPLTDPARQGRDGLWIVEADAEATVEALVREDPFWPTGLRGSYAILPWRQVYVRGRRLIDP